MVQDTVQDETIGSAEVCLVNEWREGTSAAVEATCNELPEASDMDGLL